MNDQSLSVDALNATETSVGERAQLCREIQAKIVKFVLKLRLKLFYRNQATASGVAERVRELEEDWLDHQVDSRLIASRLRRIRMTL